MTEIDQIELLKAALRKAILTSGRTTKRLINYDPAGSDYALDWTTEVKEWASLCDLDLEQHDPFFYTMF